MRLPSKSSLFPYTTLSDLIHVMLLTHDKYRQFTNKEIADAHRTSAALICVSEDSREAVDATDRKSTRLNSSHMSISYAVFCLKKKKSKKFQNLCRGHALPP